MDKKDEFGFVDKVDWRKIYIGVLREAIAKLELEKTLMLKYEVADGLPLDEIVAKCDTSTFHNAMEYDIDYYDFAYDADGVEYESEDARPNYEQDTIMHVVYSAFDDIDAEVRDKMMDAWTSEYKKHNGCLPSRAYAFENFDSLSKSGWFDDVSGCDPDVAETITKYAQDYNRRRSNSAAPIDHDIVNRIRDCCENPDFAMSDDERKASEGVLQWYLDAMHDFVRSTVKTDYWRDIHFALKSCDPDGFLYNSVFESYRPSWDAMRDVIKENSSEIFDCFDILKPDPGRLIKFPDYSGMPALLDLAADISEPYAHDKKHWASPVEFMTDCLINHGNREFVAKFRDSDTIPPYSYKPFLSAISDKVHDLHERMEADIRKDVGVGRAIDVRGFISNAFDPHVARKPAAGCTREENLFRAICDNIHETSVDPFHDFECEVIPTYGRGINFDDLTRICEGVDLSHKQFPGSTPESVKTTKEDVIANIELAMAQYISDEGVKSTLGPEVRSFIHDPFGYSHSHKGFDEQLLASVKDRLDDVESLPEDLRNALGEMDDNGVGLCD